MLGAISIHRSTRRRSQPGQIEGHRCVVTALLALHHLGDIVPWADATDPNRLLSLCHEDARLLLFRRAHTIILMLART